MKLTFIGRGAAFNPKEGNTSAYFIENNELFLIDCGESIFSSLKNKEILDNVVSINLLITHTHSDHIGSLGSLVMYAYYVRHIPFNIIIPKEAKYLENIKAILFGFGCTNDMYCFITEDDFDNKINSFDKVRYFETFHCDTLNCYSIVFYTNNGIVFYSGDTRETNTLDTIIKSNDLIDKIYMDTNISSKDTGHLGVDDLYDFIPKELVKKVYCMHLSSDECMNKAIDYGFNIVNI